MSALTKKYIDELDQGVKEIFTSGKWREYLEFLSKFHNYSVNNTIAIFRQRPDASLVASFTDWRKRGRSVRKGERGIKVIAPHTYIVTDKQTGEEKQQIGFHISYCFDVSQTCGKELPEEPCRALASNVDGYAALRDALICISPVPVAYQPIDSSAYGYYSPAQACIVVKDNLPELQTVKTTIHEIAHAMLHGKDCDEEHANRHTREVQAESVAYTVCRYLGLDTSEYSFGYVASWSESQTTDELKVSVEAIARTADQIIKGIETYRSPNAA